MLHRRVLFAVRSLLALSLLLALIAGCERLRTPQPPPTEVDRLLAKLHWGNLAFRAPAAIGYGDTKPVQLLVSGSTSARDLVQSLTKTELDILEAHELQVADVMQAHLTGDGFAITEVTPEIQPVGSTRPTEWKWDIAPRGFGRLPLHLSVNAVLVLDGEERTRSIRTFDRTIEVTVSWPQTFYVFVGRYWQWLCTALVLPLLGYAWKRRRGRGPPRELEQT